MIGRGPGRFCPKFVLLQIASEWGQVGCFGGICWSVGDVVKNLFIAIVNPKYFLVF